MAIVGAGLAGLRCARLLSARGIAVTLIDRKADITSHIHTTGIFVRKTLDDFPIPADCVGSAVSTVRLISPAGRSLVLTSPHEEFRVGRMARLYSRLLRESLSAGAVFLPGTRFINSRPAGEGSVLRCEHAGAPFDLHARFIIGADGARSRLAADLGLDRNSEWIVGVEDVMPSASGPGTVNAGGDPPRMDCHLDPRIAPGYLAWVVDDGQEIHVGVGGYPERFNPAQALLQFRGRVGPGLPGAGAIAPQRRGGLIPVNGILSRIACPRGLLVGDAAGAVSPLTAGGLDPAIRLSTLAADLTARRLAGDTRCLESYAGARFAARFISRKYMRRALSGIRSTALTEFMCAGLRLWPMRRLAEYVFFGRGSFPDVGMLPKREAAGTTA